MKSTSKEIIKQEIERNITKDKYDLPLYVCRNLKIDLTNLFKRYGLVEEGNIKLSVKVLSTNKYILQVDCLMDNFFFSNLHI